MAAILDEFVAVEIWGTNLGDVVDYVNLLTFGACRGARKRKTGTYKTGTRRASYNNFFISLFLRYFQVVELPEVSGQRSEVSDSQMTEGG
jgi:hypothetical protein